MSEQELGSRRETWDTLAVGYDDRRAHDIAYHVCVAAAAEAVPVVRGRILDVGCGTGLVTSRLAQRGANRLVGVDFSLASLQFARERLRDRIWCVQADARHLPFRDGVFEAVVCANTLQHFRPAEQRQVVQELERVNTGSLVVSAHHFSRAKRKAGWKKEGKPGEPRADYYMYRFSRDEMQALFPRGTIRAIGFTARGSSLFGRWIGGLAARLGFGHMLLARTRS